VNNAHTGYLGIATRTPGDRRTSLLKGVFLLGVLSAATGVAQAQTAAAPVDDSVTFHGITLYGIVDVGLQYQTHGAPINDYFVAGSADIVQKNSNHSIMGVTPSNLSQSRVGLQGIEPLVGDWSGVFKLETFFNPQSGQISDALKSLAQNNGRPLGSQTTNLDSSVAGQAFQQSFAGFSSKTFGTITFGRQNTVLADGVAKYDPNFASQAFSLIGLSGTTAGGGDTQSRRMDQSLKYVGAYGSGGALVHLNAEYKFNGASGAANTAFEVAVGGEFAGVSVDAFYSKVNDAVSVAALSAAQVAGLAALCPNPLPAGTNCIAADASTALAGTVSDNTAYALMGLYNMGVVKFYAGYEHIQYANPNTPLAAGFNVSGYTIAFVNVQSGPKATYVNDKTLQVFWAGVRYTVVPNLDLTAAYYGYKQNAYGTGAVAGCGTNASGTCSGTEDDVSFDADYRLNKRFDVYAGVMYTGVKNGLANGYIYNTTDLTTTTGVRFKF
jgi:predicted porin